jgi:hypothetical protein
LQHGDFPHTRALVGDGDIRANWERLAAQALERDRFELGLARLLDGIELDLGRNGRSRRTPFRASRENA